MKIKSLHHKSGQRTGLVFWRHVRGGKVPTQSMALCTDNRTRRVYVENNLHHAFAFVMVKGVKFFVEGRIFGRDNLTCSGVSYDPNKTIKLM